MAIVDFDVHHGNGTEQIVRAYNSTMMGRGVRGEGGGGEGGQNRTEAGGDRQECSEGEGQGCLKMLYGSVHMLEMFQGQVSVGACRARLYISICI